MHLLTIGQMARLNHVSEQTLRLYDRQGLLSPSVRGDNGYRYYDIKQSAVLDIIQYLKSLGIGLKEIKFQFSEQDLDGIAAALQKKRRQTQEEIKALQCREKALERTIADLRRFRTAPPDGTIQMEYIPDRQMYLIDTKVNFYDYDLDIYESVLRQLQDGLIKNKLPQNYFCNAGTRMASKNYLSQRFYSTEAFVFVDQEFVSDQLITLCPGGNYACIYCDDFYKEKEYAKKLLQYIEKQNCQVSGDYLCEVISDLPLLFCGERKMFLRLQVPVMFCTKNE